MMKSIVVSRKGQLGGLTFNILALGIASIVLVMILVILQGVRNTNVVAAALSGSATNQTVSTVTETGVSLSTAPGCQAIVSVVINATGSGFLINSGNYSISGCNIRYSASGGNALVNGSNWNVTYTDTFGDTSYTTANSTIIGIGTFGTFWSIIVLAIVAAIVLGIIFGVFGRPGGHNR